jgi:tetraacyldisaccharide 4'-kinase
MKITEIITSFHQNPRAGCWVMVGLFPVYLASLAYGAAMRVRRWCYRVGILRSRRLPAVVVCVGNITTGGTGKTPAVIHLARRIAGSGIKIAVISRGYGFHITGDYLIVSGPDGPLREAGQAPDEALMTARKLPGVPVVVSPDRYRAGKAAMDCFGAEVLLMDDGFQHLGLFRDINVLVVDGANPVGNGLVLPAGPLREPVSGAERADVVWLYGREQERLPAGLMAFLGGKPIIRARTVPGGLVTGTGKAIPARKLSGTRVLAFCGIARPQRFFEAVGRMGAVTADRKAFPDHHRYSDDDVDRLNRRAREARAGLMVTTEKDLARLSAGKTFKLPVAALVMDLDVTGDDALIEMVAERLKERTA